MERNIRKMKDVKRTERYGRIKILEVKVKIVWRNSGRTKEGFS